MMVTSKYTVPFGGTVMEEVEKLAEASATTLVCVGNGKA